MFLQNKSLATCWPHAVCSGFSSVRTAGGNQADKRASEGPSCQSQGLVVRLGSFRYCKLWLYEPNRQRTYEDLTEAEFSYFDQAQPAAGTVEAAPAAAEQQTFAEATATELREKKVILYLFSWLVSRSCCFMPFRVRRLEPGKSSSLALPFFTPAFRYHCVKVGSSDQFFCA